MGFACLAALFFVRVPKLAIAHQSFAIPWSKPTRKKHPKAGEMEIISTSKVHSGIFVVCWVLLRSDLAGMLVNAMYKPVCCGGTTSAWLNKFNHRAAISSEREKHITVRSEAITGNMHSLCWWCFGLCESQRQAHCACKEHLTVRASFSWNLTHVEPLVGR